MNLFQDKQTCVHGCNILWPPTWANMIGGGLPWHHPHKKKSIYAKISTATNVWWWPVCCNHSNQVAARRSSRSQNSRPQQGVAWIGPNSCYATAVCRWHCVDDETARVFSASKFRQQDDKLTSQKPEGGTYIAKKNTNGQKTMSQTIQKKKERVSPMSLRFSHQLRRTVEVPLQDLPTRPEAARQLLHLVSPAGLYLTGC